MNLSDMDDITEALTALWESSDAADGDLCGEVREWHLPRIRKAVTALTRVFPRQAMEAMLKARQPNGGLIVKD